MTLLAVRLRVVFSGRAFAAPLDDPVDILALFLKPAGQYSAGQPGHSCAMPGGQKAQCLMHVFGDCYHNCLTVFSCHSKSIQAGGSIGQLIPI